MVPMGNQQDNLRNLQGSRIADAPEIIAKKQNKTEELQI